jgi:hypothetical protein
MLRGGRFGHPRVGDLNKALANVQLGNNKSYSYSLQTHSWKMEMGKLSARWLLHGTNLEE